MFVDTHLHLDEISEPGAAVSEAVAAGVTRLITMSVDLPSSRHALGLAEQRSEVFAAVGHHAMNKADPNLDELDRLAGHAKAVAVGEVGLDGTYLEMASMDRQRAWFDSMCQLARRHGLPLCVHTRRSEVEVHEVLTSQPGLTGVMHYFSLDWEWAKKFLDLGFHLSFAGLVTRPSRDELREVARRCPADRLLLETDSPFGTPQAHKGKPNRPAYLVETALVVAELRGISLADLGEITTRNARVLFSKLR